MLGHDLKVGRGGIREIEFFAQTQQLILGGREPELRSPQTCAALAALAERRWVETGGGRELTAAYRFLRELEHRLQMVADRQTQALPEREPDFERFAAFAGFADAGRAGARWCATTLLDGRAPLCRPVRARARPRRPARSLVFTGTDDDPDDAGRPWPAWAFKRPVGDLGAGSAPGITAISAPPAATRARELLTELMPALLRRRCATSPTATRAFRLFDEFLTGLPAGRAAVLAVARQPEPAEPAGRPDGRGTRGSRAI